MRAACPLLAPLIGGGYPPRALPVEGFHRMQSELSGASPERTEPTPLLNHETSDHLLSLVKTLYPAWIQGDFESSGFAEQVLF